MNKEKAMQFVKEHKAKIILGAGIVLGGVLVAFTRKSNVLSREAFLETAESGIKDIPIPENFAVGEVDTLFETDDEIVSIIRNVTLNSFGNLGKEFVKHGLATDKAEACVVVEILKDE